MHSAKVAENCAGLFFCSGAVGEMTREHADSLRKRIVFSACGPRLLPITNYRRHPLACLATGKSLLFPAAVSLLSFPMERRHQSQLGRIGFSALQPPAMPKATSCTLSLSRKFKKATRQITTPKRNLASFSLHFRFESQRTGTDCGYYRFPLA